MTFLNRALIELRDHEFRFCGISHILIMDSKPSNSAREYHNFVRGGIHIHTTSLRSWMEKEWTDRNTSEFLFESSAAPRQLGLFEIDQAFFRFLRVMRASFRRASILDCRCSGNRSSRARRRWSR